MYEIEIDHISSTVDRFSVLIARGDL